MVAGIVSIGLEDKIVFVEGERGDLTYWRGYDEPGTGVDV